MVGIIRARKIMFLDELSDTIKIVAPIQSENSEDFSVRWRAIKR